MAKRQRNGFWTDVHETELMTPELAARLAKEFNLKELQVLTNQEPGSEVTYGINPTKYAYVAELPDLPYAADVEFPIPGHFNLQGLQLAYRNASDQAKGTTKPNHTNVLVPETPTIGPDGGPAFSYKLTHVPDAIDTGFNPVGPNTADLLKEIANLKETIEELKAELLLKEE